MSTDPKMDSKMDSKRDSKMDSKMDSKTVKANWMALQKDSSKLLDQKMV